jgi:hypothetical protein
MFKFKVTVTVKRWIDFKVKFGFRLQHAPSHILGDKTISFGPLHLKRASTRAALRTATIVCSCRLLSR